MTAMATGDANDDKNLVALRIHTDVHNVRMHRSNTWIHEAPRVSEYWMRKCLNPVAHIRSPGQSPQLLRLPSSLMCQGPLPSIGVTRRDA